MKKARFRIAATGFLLLVVGANSTHAQDFQLSGVMKVTPHQVTIPPYTYDFRVSRHECEWRISTTCQWGPNRVTDELSDDGKYIYLLTHIDREREGQGWQTVSNSWSGTIHRPGFPCHMVEPALVGLFYVYTAQCYLDSLTNGFLDPIKFQPIELTTGNTRVKAQVTRSAGQLRFPERICFFDYAGSKTNAVLNVTEVTNVAGLTLPSKASLIRFLWDSSSLTHYDISLDSVAVGMTLDSFTPNLPAPALISDYRFSHGRADVPPISDYATNRTWLTEAEAKKRPEYQVTQLDWEEIQKLSAQHTLEKLQRLSAQHSTRTSRTRAARAFCIVVLLLGPPVLAIIFLKRRK